MNIPFLLIPASKDYLWGGSRLNDDFNLKLPDFPLAEAWVCSCHPDGPSLVSAGETLAEVLEAHPEYLGTHAREIAGGRFPILAKLIDAKTDLSVQVHPNDAYAAQVEGSLGKTEMWYVLDAKLGANLVYGFREDVTVEDVKNAVGDGTIGTLLNFVPVNKNDVFFVEPGIVHAIGAGCLIAEIQQSSNVTYRLYDYGRVGKDGKKRELHLDRALEVLNLKSSSAPRQPMRILRYRPGYASELLCSCRYFQVERLLLNTEVLRELVNYQTGSNSFHVLFCMDGCGSISGEEVHLNFFKGDCVFVPADSGCIKLHGRAQMLDVSC